MVRDVKGGIKVACGDDKFRFGYGLAGIRQWIVEVKITQNQVRVGEKRKNPLSQYGAVGRAICTKKVYRGNPEGTVGGSK